MESLKNLSNTWNEQLKKKKINNRFAPDPQKYENISTQPPSAITKKEKEKKQQND